MRVQQLLDTARSVRDSEGFQQPPADLIRVAEAAGTDFTLELLDLVRGEIARIALVMQQTQGVESLIAEDTQPVAQLGETNTQEFCDFSPRFACGNGQDGRKTLIDASLMGIFASALDLLALFGSKLNRFHRSTLL